MEVSKEKFEMIEELTARDNNLLNISWLCEIAEVSRSGYYNWVSNKDKRKEDEERDERDFEIIVEVYNYRGYKKGSRSIYMRLLHEGKTMNRKKIQRLMRKFNLICPIRKANPYRRMAKALRSDVVADHIVNRTFKQKARYIILTDITYIPYGEKKRAYLSVMKDAYTNEVLAYVWSESLEVDFVVETGTNLLRDHGKELEPDALVHSDQGFHYTSIAFRTFLKDEQLTQSMSRRGNCWDNAPQESFFGHMKDEMNIEHCNCFEELKVSIDDYMDYYNHERYQWKLAKLSPRQYYDYTISGIYPIIQKGTD